MLTLTTLSAVILHSHGRGDGQPGSVLSGKCLTTWGMWEEVGSQGYCALKGGGGPSEMVWKADMKISPCETYGEMYNMGLPPFCQQHAKAELFEV